MQRWPLVTQGRKRSVGAATNYARCFHVDFLDVFDLYVWSEAMVAEVLRGVSCCCCLYRFLALDMTLRMGDLMDCREVRLEK